jgi:fructokinase
MNEQARIGIDLGGTKIAGILLGLNGSPAANTRTDTPKGDYRKTLDSVCGLISELEEANGSEAKIGIGIPGSVSPATGLIQNSNSTWLNAKPLKQDLELILGRKIRMANDANCFALSEAFDGAGQGSANVFGVILGTGCGGGLIQNGRVIDGPHGISGEWGHNPLPWPEADEIPGPTCWCGRQSCIETWVSGPGMTADHARTFGEVLTAEVIEKKANKGCANCGETLERHISRLARSLASLINIIDPGRIVLGGGLSNMGHLYEQLPKLIAPHIFSDNPNIDIRHPTHGAESGVRGAARLWD